MSTKQILIALGKLILCGLAFYVGTMLGGMIATMLGLPLPTAPQGADMSMLPLYMLLTTPLIAFALAILAQHLAGNFIVRAGALSLLLWIAYTVNTQLEATIVSTYAAGIWFALVSGFFAALFCGIAVAFFLAPNISNVSARQAAENFFARHSVVGWLWRLAIAAVAFMPIYFVFGLLVLPFTGEYYRQQMFGLVAPTLETLLPILFTRSVLFLLACLPILVLWQASARALFWRLGLALFFFVGFVIMLYATWLPLYVRVPHLLEIFADEFVYAAALVLLLVTGNVFARAARRPVSAGALAQLARVKQDNGR